MRVLVTGGTGFVGSALVRHLVSAGDEVVLLHRRTSDLRLVADLPLDRREGDLGDLDALVSAARGTEAVYHVAAVVAHRERDRDRLIRANVVGTKNACEAALRAEVRRFIHTSSVAAVGVGEDGDPVDETCAWDCAGRGLPYFESKRAAEEEVARAIGRGLDAVLVNPPTVIGVGDIRHLIGRFVKAIARWGAPVPAGGTCFVDNRDLAVGYRLALERGRRGERYILGGENVPYTAFAAEVARAMGRVSRARTAPGWLLRILARVPGSDLTPGLARLAGRRVYYDSGKARRELGWTARPLADTVTSAVEDYRRSGYF